MSGYTPLFNSLTSGSLYGRWPDIGLWPIILSLSDRHGVVDVTPYYIAGVTGLPVEEVAACMKRFCEPDPYSRSDAEEGRRLELLDEHRDWGWRIINHAKYREKARLAQREVERVNSGENRRRMAARRATPADPRQPPATPADPPSDTDTDTDTDADAGEDSTATASPRVCREAPRKKSARKPDPPPEFDALKAIFPKRAGSQPWPDALLAINARLKEGHTWEEILDGARRYARFIRAEGEEGTRHVLQAKTFCGPSKRFLEPFELARTKGDRRLDANLTAAEEARQQLFREES